MSSFTPRIHSDYIHTVHLPILPIDEDEHDPDMYSLCGCDVSFIDDQFSTVNCLDCLQIAYYRSILSKN